ncbi:MAG: lysostaphin resistance A-like protein [Planctomycetota bacterium]|jgi:membrane protease YdiL (CAAX protease family)
MRIARRSGLLLGADGRVRVGWRIAIFFAGLMVLERAAGEGYRALVRWRPDALGRWAFDLQMVLMVLLTTATAGLVWACRRGLDRRSFLSMGLGWDRRARLDGGIGLALGAGLVLGSVLLTAALGYGSWRLASPGEIGWPLHAGRLFLALVGLLAAALFEEIVYRGYIAGGLAESGRPYLGALVSSLLFAAGHANNPGAWESPLPLLNMFLSGATLALLYLRLRCLWGPWLAHFGWNYALLLSGGAVSGLSGPRLLEQVMRGPASVTGSEYGVEGGLMTTGFHAAAIIALFFWKGRAERAGS